MDGMGKSHFERLFNTGRPNPKRVTTIFRGFYFCCYPSSHNHGSAEHDPNLLKKRSWRYTHFPLP